MNDLKDVDIDSKNPRKGGIHGAKASSSNLWICVVISVVATMALPPLLIPDFAWCITWSCVVMSVNWLYNFGPTLSRVPVLDMVLPLGYLCILPFSAKLFGLEFYGGPWSVTYMAFVIFRTQLWFQRFDATEDEESGKCTTAVLCGPTRAMALLILFLICEVAAGSLWGCAGAQAYSCYSMCVLAIEVFVAGKTTTLALMGASCLFIVPFYPCLVSSWQVPPSV